MNQVPLDKLMPPPPEPINRVTTSVFEQIPAARQNEDKLVSPDFSLNAPSLVRTNTD